MLAGGPSARAFGLCGRTPVDAVQTNVYHVPESRTGIALSTRMHITNSPAIAANSEEARGVKAPFAGLRAHSTHGAEGAGGGPVGREGETPLSMRVPYSRPLIAPSQRFRCCTGTSVLSVCPGSCSVVPSASIQKYPDCAVGWCVLCCQCCAVHSIVWELMSSDAFMAV